jgi:peptidyl-prolyl cis-trans isomerase C
VSSRRAALAAAALVGCSGPAKPVGENRTLGGHVLARVGESEISEDLVVAVARAESIAPHQALGRLVDDAVAAAGARQAGLEHDPATAYAIRRALAQRTVVHVLAEAAAAGAPNDAELGVIARDYWRDVDLPERRVVIHAVTLKKNKPELDAKALEVAQEIARAVAGARDADDFDARAKAVPAETVEVKIERLSPFIADGQTAEGPPSSYDPAFTAAAFALAVPGDTSGVVPSEFGWHVIRLIDKLPPRSMPTPERVAHYFGTVENRRASEALTGILKGYRAKVEVGISSAADSLMQTVSFERPSDSDKADP